MSFEKKEKKRRNMRPINPVEAGVRPRGLAKRLTPFIAFRGELAGQVLGQPHDPAGWDVIVLVGKGKDAGKVRILPAPKPEDANARVRRPGTGQDEFILETVLIPYEGTKNHSRSACKFERLDGPGADVVLPWGLSANGGNL